MASGFRRHRGHVTAGLEAGEARLLDALFADVASLLEADDPPVTDPLAAELGLADLEIGDVVDPPADPAVARLLPAGHRDDDALAAEYRRFTDSGLRRRKGDGLRLVRLSLERASGRQPDDEPLRVRLDPAESQAWVVALTDLRLVLAERLGIRTDADAEALHDRVSGTGVGAGDAGAGDDDSDDAARAGEQWLSMVYDFVSWLQETLTEVLLADLPPEGDGRRPEPPGL